MLIDVGFLAKTKAVEDVFGVGHIFLIQKTSVVAFNLEPVVAFNLEPVVAFEELEMPQVLPLVVAFENFRTPPLTFYPWRSVRTPPA
jgi:hypothetical protein